MWGGGDDYILRSCSHPAGGDVTTSLVKVSWLHHQLPQAYKTSAFFFQVVFLLLLLSLTFVSFCFRVALIHVVKKKKKSAPLFPSEIRKFGREFTLLGDCLQLLLFSYFLYLSQPFLFFSYPIPTFFFLFPPPRYSFRSHCFPLYRW